MNTIVEDTDGPGAVLDSGGNIIATGDAEETWCWLMGREMSLLLMRRATPSSKPQTDRARCLALMATSSRPEMSRALWC